MPVSFPRAVVCLLAVGATLAISSSTRGQALQLSFNRLSLDDMTAFRSGADNWRIAGGVQVSRTAERAMYAAPGAGILVNQPAETEDPGNLFTKWTHGDLSLELEYMMPEGSNSGLYFQGRYEIQLLDSWGVQNPTYADAGGIYQRWDHNRAKGKRGYEGHPPLVNVSRAPGLWQHLEIVFRAPRFNQDGEKLANARFVKVVHNGVVIQENVEVTGPTRGSALQGEASRGPLMIQGNHGPVAFRNFRYKRYGNERVALTDLRFSYYEGEFNGPLNLAERSSHSAGAAEDLTWRVGQNQDQYALKYTGTLEVPVSGTYLFVMQSAGSGHLLIGDTTVVNYEGSRRARTESAGKIDLKAGSYPFQLVYSKTSKRLDSALGLFIEGPGIARQPLHSSASLSQEEPVNPIYVEAVGQPVVLRSFINHGGQKRTYCVSVGEFSGPHYSLDVAQAALLQVWKGPFLNTTPMWHGRGHAQVAVPRGSVIELSGAPSVALLPGEDAPWPDSLDSAGYRFKEYRLDEAGRPTFMYDVHTVAVEDHIAPSEDKRSIIRTMRFSSAEVRSNLWVHLASSDEIERLEGGSYAIDDRTYYIDIAETGAAQAVIREQSDHTELLFPVHFDGTSSNLRYAIVW